MAEVETAEPPERATLSDRQPSKPPNRKPKDLVAREIAPVKPEYLRPPPLRPNRSDEGAIGKDKGASRSVPDNGADLKPVVTQEKKSKLQLKRERRQERKATYLCRAFASNSCRRGEKCRFCHDLEGFLQQKSEDLPGTCPFVQLGESCPYGVGCRFSGTHEEPTRIGESSLPKRFGEVNGLNKDLLTLLSKNKVDFPKADAQLKLLGLLGGKSSMRIEENEDAKEKDTDNRNGCSLLKQNENDEIGSTKTLPDTVCSPALISKEDFVNNTNNQIGCSLPKQSENDEIESTKTLPDSACGPAVISKEDFVNGSSLVSDSRPSKRVKISDDEVLDANEKENGTSLVEGNVLVESQTECESGGSSDLSQSTRIEVTPKLNVREKKLIDFREKLYLAPLTTVGNLPFRRVCKIFGADITCGQMTMCTNLLQGKASEWALLRRHSSEDIFGIQICGSYPDTVARTIELINGECDVDFIDINMGCPVDVVVNKGAGSSLLTNPVRMKSIIQAACGTMDKPLTVKVRTGYSEGQNQIDSLVPDISHWGATAVTIHGRSRQQRYDKFADWDYIYECARKAPDTLQVMGNGDIFSYLDWNKHASDCPQLSTCMIARGALIKPWIFTEIKEQRHWDITSEERLDMLKNYVNFGLQHWGSDSKGVQITRYFLLDWLSYTCRYIPVGLLDVIPQRLNWRSPSYYGRNDLETLMASDSTADWIRISEMLLGKVPDGFSFAAKHKSNAYVRAVNG